MQGGDLAAAAAADNYPAGDEPVAGEEWEVDIDLDEDGGGMGGGISNGIGGGSGASGGDKEGAAGGGWGEDDDLDLGDDDLDFGNGKGAPTGKNVFGCWSFSGENIDWFVIFTRKEVLGFMKAGMICLREKAG